MTENVSVAPEIHTEWYLFTLEEPAETKFI